MLQPDALLKLFQVDATTYYRKRIQDPYIYAYRFQVLTGLRPGELMGLRWADVHGNTLQISRSINIEGTQTRGKNDNSVRAFVMSELARAVLEQQRQQGEQSALRAVAQCAGDPHALQAMLAGFLLAAGCRAGRRCASTASKAIAWLCLTRRNVYGSPCRFVGGANSYTVCQYTFSPKIDIISWYKSQWHWPVVRGRMTSSS